MSSPARSHGVTSEVIPFELSKCFARHVVSRKALLWAVLWLPAAPYLGAVCHGSPELEAKVRTQPTAKAYADLGTWFRNRRQFDCAAETFEKALKMKPDSASLAYLLGASLYSAGNVKEAIVSLQQSVRLNSKALQPHLTLGAALDDAHDTTNAEIEWRAALALDPKSATARNALSKDLLAEKDYGSEIALLRPGSASGTLTVELTLDLALAYGEMGRLQDANELLRTALRAHPASPAPCQGFIGDARLASSQGGSCRRSGNRDEAAPGRLENPAALLADFGDARRDRESPATGK